MKRKEIKKRMLAAGLSVVLALGTFSGCGGSSGGKDNASTGDNSEVSRDEISATQYTGEPEELTLPLTEDQKTITIYAKNSSSGVLTDYGDLKAFQVAAEKTGVTIEWIMPASGSESDQFNLMIASGKYPDIIFWDFTSTPMGLAGLIDDGIAIEMDNLVRQYAPNYLACLESDDEMMKQALSDNGTFDIMYKLEPDEARLSHSGPAIRKDLLDKYSLEVPVTIDDWHNVLTVLKEKESGVTAPVTVAKGTDGSVHFSMFMSAYNTNSTFLIDADSKKVVYGPITDNYKAYLTTMAEWYAEGLLDSEYMTNDYSAMIGKISSGKSVAGVMALGGMIGSITNKVRATNPEFEIVGAPWPVLEKGNTSYTLLNESNIRSGNMGAIITKDCSDPKLAVKLLDYFYSEEGADLLNWGIEGESYTEENGVKTYTEAVLNDVSGKSVSEAVQQWAQPLQGFTKPMEYEAWRQITLVLPEQIVANETWSESSTELLLPTLILPSKQNEEYTQMMSDITTYTNEMSMQFITGQLSIEKEWDSYVETMKGMGIETVVLYKQEALDRYNNRE